MPGVFKHRCSAACTMSRVECLRADRVVILQLEVELDNLAQLEAFWAQIPPQAHKAWSQRAQVCFAVTTPFADSWLVCGEPIGDS